MEFYCYLQNIQGSLAGGRKPHEKRYYSFMLVGAEISDKSMSPKSQTSTSAWQQDVPWTIHRVRPAYGRNMVRRLSYRGLERSRKVASHQKSTSKDSSPKKYKSPQLREHMCSHVLAEHSNKKDTPYFDFFAINNFERRWSGRRVRRTNPTTGTMSRASQVLRLPSSRCTWRSAARPTRIIVPDPSDEVHRREPADKDKKGQFGGTHH